MSHILIAGTENGTLVCEPVGATWRVARHALVGQIVTAVSTQGRIALAGTTDGIFRSDDRGQTWHAADDGLELRHIRQLAFHPTEPGLALAGTEPASIFVTHDGGEHWRECPEVAQLRTANGWFLPYSPGAGCVRSFSFLGQRVYAAAEIGGLLRSDDAGDTWRLVGGSSGIPNFREPVVRTRLHPDVHDVSTHAESPDLVYAATMQGLYRSTDGGQKWLHIYADCYVRAVWLDPHNPARMVLGPGDDVSINGQVEESRDHGYTWTVAADGMATPWRRAVVERFVQAGDELFAVISDGRLFAASCDTLRWRSVLQQAGTILDIAVAPCE